MYILISYIFLLNLIGLLLMSSDKKRAKKENGESQKEGFGL